MGNEIYIECPSCKIGGYDNCPECLGAGGFTKSIDPESSKNIHVTDRLQIINKKIDLIANQITIKEFTVEKLKIFIDEINKYPESDKKTLILNRIKKILWNHTEEANLKIVQKRIDSISEVKIDIGYNHKYRQHYKQYPHYAWLFPNKSFILATENEYFITVEEKGLCLKVNDKGLVLTDKLYKSLFESIHNRSLLTYYPFKFLNNSGSHFLDGLDKRIDSLIKFTIKNEKITLYKFITSKHALKMSITDFLNSLNRKSANKIKAISLI